MTSKKVALQISQLLMVEHDVYFQILFLNKNIEMLARLDRKYS